MTIRRKLFFAFIGVVAVPLAIATLLAVSYLGRARGDLDQRFVEQANAAFKSMREQGERRLETLRADVHRAAEGYDFSDDAVAVQIVVGPDAPAPLADGAPHAPRPRFNVTSGVPSQIVNLRKAHPEILGVRLRAEGADVSFSNLTPELAPLKVLFPNGRPVSLAGLVLDLDERHFVIDRLDDEDDTEMVVEFDPRRLIEPERIYGSGWTFYVAPGAGAWHLPFDIAHAGPGGERLASMIAPLTAVGDALPAPGALARVRDQDWVRWSVYNAVSPQTELVHYQPSARLIAMAREDEIYAPLVWFRVEVFGALLASLLVAAWLAYFLSGRLVGAVDRIRSGVEALSRGEWAQLDKLSEDELGGGLVESVNQMAAALAERTRKEEIEGWRRLVRVLSHEINNTLGPVRSVAVTVRDQVAGRSGADAAEDLRVAFQLIVDRTDALTGFIAGYAELAKLPEPALAHADLNAVVGGGARLFREAAERAGVTLAVALDGGAVRARLDAGQIERVVINLVKNAVEAVGQGGEVRVATARRPGAIELTVEDNGPGIAPEARRHLFIPYFTTKPGGSGIGLALVRQIVLGHGGTVSAEDRPGGGTRMRVALPSL